MSQCIFIDSTMQSVQFARPVLLHSENKAVIADDRNKNSFVRKTPDSMAPRASQRIQSPEHLELLEATQSIVDLFRRSGGKAMTFPYNGASGNISAGFGGVLMSLPLNVGGKKTLELHISGSGSVGSQPKVSEGEMTAILKLAIMGMQQNNY